MLYYKCKANITIIIAIETCQPVITGQKKQERGSVTLKTKIQELRKQNRVTQEELADALGVTRQTIISLENGKYNASLQLAHKIAVYFEQTIEEIFLFEEE